MSCFNKLRKSGVFSFGEVISGLKINGKSVKYPVLNDRAVRATAGIMFVLGFFSFMQAYYLREFVFLRYIVVLFFVDFFLKVFIGPRVAPLSIIGSFIVSSQKPEYVGAIQKRFAWSIGLIIAGSMTVMVHGFGLTGIVPLSFCLVCLLFMFLETSFGICVGCKFYWGLVGLSVISKPVVVPACSGGNCPIPKKKW